MLPGSEVLARYILAGKLQTTSDLNQYLSTIQVEAIFRNFTRVQTLSDLFLNLDANAES